jgi:DNA-binding MarR family transcriptional regulator
LERPTASNKKPERLQHQLQDDPILLAIERAWTRLARIPTRSRSYGLVLAHVGLSLERSAYPILAYLRDLGSARMTDLADAIGIDLSTLSRQVAVLERRKLVVRVLDPEDARVRALRPTQKGAAALSMIASAHQLFIRETLAAWTKEDRATLAALMARLMIDAERYLEDQMRATSSVAEATPKRVKRRRLSESP